LPINPISASAFGGEGYSLPIEPPLEAQAPRRGQPPLAPQVTALKNAVTAVEQDTRGLSPGEEVERRSWDQAKAILTKKLRLIRQRRGWWTKSKAKGFG
jgi:hypothetical protein